MKDIYKRDYLRTQKILIKCDYIRIWNILKCDFTKIQKISMQCDFIHSVICLTTGPKPLPQWFLHIV